VNWTNSKHLPEILCAAIRNDKYSGTGADYSTTGLLRAPRIVQLTKQHKDQLTEDYADRIWALFGTVTHGIIERAATDELVEKRLYMQIAGKTVSGQIDLYQGHTLWDFKTCSIYSGKYGAKDEWIQQGNINYLLCLENGIEVNKIQFVALYRDFSIMAQARGKQDYPESQVEIFEIPIWHREKTKAFVEERISLHEAAKTELPLCTEEERWAKPEKWAHVKRGQKRAVKLYDSAEQAEAAAKNAGAGNSVEHRPGQNTRCEFFCPVSAHCSQFREIVQGLAA
jgi:hypothetical protein